MKEKNAHRRTHPRCYLMLIVFVFRRDSFNLSVLQCDCSLFGMLGARRCSFSIPNSCVARSIVLLNSEQALARPIPCCSRLVVIRSPDKYTTVELVSCSTIACYNQFPERGEVWPNEQNRFSKNISTTLDYVSVSSTNGINNEPW